MKARLLGTMMVLVCLAAATGRSVLGQGPHPGGPPPGSAPPAGVPPVGVPPAGVTPGGLPGGGGPQGGPGGSGPGRQDGPGSAAAGAGMHRSNNAAHSSVQFGPVGRWWDDRTVVQSIGLRHEQQRQMDTIFNANKPAIVSSYKTFLNEQAKLKALNKDPKVDQTRLFTAIDEVNQARAALQKATAQMLLQIRQQMSPDQIEKLEKLP